MSEYRIHLITYSPLIELGSSFTIIGRAQRRLSSSARVTKKGRAVVRAQVGHYSFATQDAELLVSLLPQVVVARKEPRLILLMQLIGEESRLGRPARDLVLQRLLEVTLIECFRTGNDATVEPGLIRGLADEQLATVLRIIHSRPERSWTV